MIYNWILNYETFCGLVLFLLYGTINRHLGQNAFACCPFFYAGTRKGVTMNLRKHQVVNNSEISQGEQDYEE